MKVANEAEYAVICAPIIAQHVKRFPPNIEPNMPKYWDGVWLISSNEACCMCWIETANNIRMILVWNNTIKSSTGAKELVEWAKRYSKKPIVFNTFTNVSEGTQRAFEKWGFTLLSSDGKRAQFQYVPI